MSKHGHFSSAPVPTLISYFNKGGIMFFDYLTARTFRFYTNFQTDLQSKPRQKKKAPSFGEPRPKFCVFWPYGGRESIGLGCQDAHASDCKSMFYEVIASTKRLKFRNSKAASGTQPAALPCPPYVLCSWTAVVGLSNRR